MYKANCLKVKRALVSVADHINVDTHTITSIRHYWITNLKCESKIYIYQRTSKKYSTVCFNRMMLVGFFRNYSLLMINKTDHMYDTFFSSIELFGRLHRHSHIGIYQKTLQPTAYTLQDPILYAICKTKCSCIDKNKL